MNEGKSSKNTITNDYRRTENIYVKFEKLFQYKNPEEAQILYNNLQTELEKSTRKMSMKLYQASLLIQFYNK